MRTTSCVIKNLALALSGVCLLACGTGNKKDKDMGVYEKGTFGYDLYYLADKDSVILLTDKDEKAQVLVSPGYQGKVFTSTVDGKQGRSLGYLNYKALESNIIDEHMNGYGGENRLWLGPEGGKYSIYFKPGKEQVYENWHTPAPFDIEPWKVLATSDTSVLMHKPMILNNYLGNTFQLEINRQVTLAKQKDLITCLGITISPEVQTVGYLTENTLTNRSDFEWTEKTGTVCIWMLDMFNTAPKSLTIVPFIRGDEKELGKIATTDYFGEIPADRLKIQDGLLFLKTDGNCRNKLGMNALRTKAIAGNYDPDSKRLTITTYDVNGKGIYLNQEWNPDKDPLKGDAMNAYNDGPLEDGSIMGPFLEVESASPAAFLKPGESLIHHHNVFHFVGEEKELTLLTEKLFGISIQDIKQIF